jgi:SAM-dependent methyltransferase
MRERFENIYATGEWGTNNGSGLGAMPKWTKPYRRFIQRFLRSQDVRSVVDVGCGDWQSSALMDWSGVDYLGLDIVPSLIERNAARYGKPNIRFRVRTRHTDPLPSADLFLCKDVMQHWSDRAIKEFLPLLQGFKHVLILNELATSGRTPHRDIPDGGFRPLDLTQPPYNVGGHYVLTYSFPNLPSRIIRKVLARELEYQNKGLLLVENIQHHSHSARPHVVVKRP